MMSKGFLSQQVVADANAKLGALTGIWCAV